MQHDDAIMEAPTLQCNNGNGQIKFYPVAEEYMRLTENTYLP